jgi:hypothetical protein
MTVLGPIAPDDLGPHSLMHCVVDFIEADKTVAPRHDSDDAVASATRPFLRPVVRQPLAKAFLPTFRLIFVAPASPTLTFVN